MTRKTSLIALALITAVLVAFPLINNQWFNENVMVHSILFAHSLFGQSIGPSPEFVMKLYLGYVAVVIVLALFFLNLIISIYRK